MLLVAKKGFRRFKDPHLTRNVFLGAKFKDGVATQPATEEKAPELFIHLLTGPLRLLDGLANHSCAKASSMV